MLDEFFSWSDSPKAREAGKVKPPQEWIQYGRPCPPLLLRTFSRWTFSKRSTTIQKTTFITSSENKLRAKARSEAWSDKLSHGNLPLCTPPIAAKISVPSEIGACGWRPVPLMTRSHATFSPITSKLLVFSQPSRINCVYGYWNIRYAAASS